MIILWITKDFSGTPGWEIIFEDKYISDGTVAIFCGVLPLILPNANPLQSEILFFLNKKIFSLIVLFKRIGNMNRLFNGVV
jgi:hypothetical protein